MRNYDYSLSLACNAVRTKNNAPKMKTKRKKKKGTKIGNEEEKRRNKSSRKDVQVEALFVPFFVSSCRAFFVPLLFFFFFFPCAFATPWKLVRGFNDSEATRN